MPDLGGNPWWKHSRISARWRHRMRRPSKKFSKYSMIDTLLYSGVETVESKIDSKIACIRFTSCTVEN